MHGERRGQGRGTARWLGLLFVISVGCSSNPSEVALDDGGTDAPDYGACEPDALLPCTCADGRSGEQLCLPSGFERGPCVCDEPMPAESGGSTSTGGTSTGGSSSDSGGSSSGGSSSTGVADTTGAG